MTSQSRSTWRTRISTGFEYEWTSFAEVTEATGAGAGDGVACGRSPQLAAARRIAVTAGSFA
jgi:hypothetical protein